MIHISPEIIKPVAKKSFEDNLEYSNLRAQKFVKPMEILVKG